MIKAHLLHVVFIVIFTTSLVMLFWIIFAQVQFPRPVFDSYTNSEYSDVVLLYTVMSSICIQKMTKLVIHIQKMTKLANCIRTAVSNLELLYCLIQYSSTVISNISSILQEQNLWIHKIFIKNSYYHSVYYPRRENVYFYPNFSIFLLKKYQILGEREDGRAAKVQRGVVVKFWGRGGN